MKLPIALPPLLAVLLLWASQCKKSKPDPYADNGLPPASQAGKMIFACRINGQPWISGTDVYHLGGGFQHDTIGVTGSPETTGYFEDLGFRIYPPLKQGETYLFRTNMATGIYLTNKNCIGNTGSVTTGFAVSGFITITRLDRVKKIFSGLFECIIPMPGCDTLKVTDGRFDIRYY